MAEGSGPKRTSDGMHWLTLPQVFVLVTTGRGEEVEAGRVYTLQQERGFYDMGMGFTSAAYMHKLLVFQDAGARACAGVEPALVDWAEG
jgi:hypothetical protein